MQFLHSQISLSHNHLVTAMETSTGHFFVREEVIFSSSKQFSARDLLGVRPLNCSQLELETLFPFARIKSLSF